MKNGRITDEDILMEDAHLLAVRKPAGIAVQNSRPGQMDLESAVRNHLAEHGSGGVPYLGVVHRLDQPVEGIVLFAKNAKAAGSLSAQLTDGRMEKEYLAVTAVRPEVPRASLLDYLRKEPGQNRSAVVRAGSPMAKESLLSYALAEELPAKENCTRYLLRIRLMTGRHHQIRVQMAHAGMPLLGDRKYNPEDPGIFSLALSAFRLSFMHPKTGKRLSFLVRPENPAFEGMHFPPDDSVLV